MTPQEKDLIQGVFDRLAAQRGAKDPEAESFIKDRAQAQPDAAYGLVQAVILLEAGLNQAQAKINEMQKQVEQGGQTGGNFLGAGSPWGGGSVPRSAPQPMQQAPQPAYYTSQAVPQPSPWAQPAGGGSFLRNAATMAAGVAGGALIAEGLTSLLGGHHYYGGGFGGGYGGPGEVVENVTVNNYYDNQASGGHQASHDNASVQDASYDTDDGDYGGSDDGFDV